MSDKYESIHTVEGMKEKAQALGITVEQAEGCTLSGRGSFHSREVTSGMKRYHLNKEDRCRRIKGLKCPDCGNQAYTTDHPQVVVCEGYPGWYFFYRKVIEKKKTEMKIINGELRDITVNKQTMT